MVSSRPGRAAVVGAGIVGLSVAWFLQQEDFDVTVFDQLDVAAGASAGNAGWITPAMTSPLPEPAVLRSALGSLLRPGSPLRIPPRSLPGTWRFLAAFAARSTTRRWLAGVASLAPISALALPSYDVLAAGGVTGAVVEAPIIAAFERPDQAGPLRHELQTIAGSGRPVRVSELTGPELSRERPLLSGRARYGLRVEGQRYVQPLEYVQSLATAVAGRGATVKTGLAVSGAASRPGGGVRVVADGQPADFDVCVLANGAWMGRLARAAGVRVPVVAGRGYSFLVPLTEPLPGPLYLPGLRVPAPRPRAGCGSPGRWSSARLTRPWTAAGSTRSWRRRGTGFLARAGARSPATGWARARSPLTGCRSSAAPRSTACSWPAGTACGA
jgi:D-amino-acid dehydrogenase